MIRKAENPEQIIRLWEEIPNQFTYECFTIICNRERKDRVFKGLVKRLVQIEIRRGKCASSVPRFIWSIEADIIAFTKSDGAEFNPLPYAMLINTLIKHVFDKGTPELISNTFKVIVTQLTGYKGVLRLIRVVAIKKWMIHFTTLEEKQKIKVAEKLLKKPIRTYFVQLKRDCRCIPIELQVLEVLALE